MSPTQWGIGVCWQFDGYGKQKRNKNKKAITDRGDTYQGLVGKMIYLRFVTIYHGLVVNEIMVYADVLMREKPSEIQELCSSMYICLNNQYTDYKITYMP